MAAIRSIDDEIELSFRLMRKSFDPFQLDLEWFEYEISIKLRRQNESAEDSEVLPATERHTVRGKINRKDLVALMRELDELLAGKDPLRFEPYDLNFYFEWSRETPRIFLIVTWFDLGLSPRRPDHRFPSAHSGFRFLAEESSIAEFRRALEEEFITWLQPDSGPSNEFVN